VVILKASWKDQSETMSNNRALTEDEVADLKEAFSMFDINGDGEFGEKEMVKLTKK
jgi:Ca2+-binding EF-hand superfamily protein